MDKVKDDYIQSVSLGIAKDSVECTGTCQAYCLSFIGALLLLSVIGIPILIVMCIFCHGRMEETNIDRIVKVTESVAEYGLVPASDIPERGSKGYRRNIKPSADFLKLDSGFSSLKLDPDHTVHFEDIQVYDDEGCFWFWAPKMCKMDPDEFNDLFTTRIGFDEDDYDSIFLLEEEMLPDDLTQEDKLQIKKALKVLSPHRRFMAGSSGSKSGTRGNPKSKLVVNVGGGGSSSKSGMSDKQKAKLAIKGGELLGDMISDFV